MSTATVTIQTENIESLGAKASAEWVLAKDRHGWKEHWARTKHDLRSLRESATIDKVWLRENHRLVETAVLEAKDASKTMAAHVHVKDADGKLVPRPYALASAYLKAVSNAFTVPSFVSFVKGVQAAHTLDMGELWAVRPALQICLLEELIALVGHHISDLSAPINSLRRVGEAEWKTLFESLNEVDRILEQDPVGAFAGMCFESKESYRREVAQLARYSEFSEPDVAKMALALATRYKEMVEAHRGARRRGHVGYYLVAEGRDELRKAVNYKSPVRLRVRELLLRYPKVVYMSGVEIATLFFVFGIVTLLGSPTPPVPILALMLIPATHAAVQLMNSFAAWLATPSSLPRLDFSEGIPEDCATAVAVPVLFINEDQVGRLMRDLEIRYLANPDPQLTYVLLSDSPDSQEAFDDKDALADMACALIDDANQRLGNHFVLLHRHRTFNPSENKWMGWERKRGKLIDLNQYVRGALDPFPVTAGDVQGLRRIRFVLTLDSDTQLPRDAAAKLVGTMAHPLNQAVVDPDTLMVVEGYGILQPRISVSVDSAKRSWLANIYSGQTGFDIYTRAVSDVYQDLFGEGIFTGKGIYEVDVFRAVLEKRFPNNALLSHDLIEGAYARVGLVTDVELIDDFPSHFSAYSRRQHRWVRGDWQVLRWLLPVVPDFYGRPIWNPISVLSAWKILDNLRRSLIQPAMLLLLLAGWFWFPGPASLWTLVTVSLWLIPAYCKLLFLIPSMRHPNRWQRIKNTLKDFAKEHVYAFFQLAFLIHQSLLSLDAIIRSLVRTMKGRRMLEWETAAEAERSTSRSTVDRYLSWTPWIAFALTAALALVRFESLPEALPVLIIWGCSLWISNALNRPPVRAKASFGPMEQQDLRLIGLKTWRYFAEFSHEGRHWLIPDNVRAVADQPAERTSPTNLGLLLNARSAALEMGWLTVDEFAAQTRKTLETMLHMERHQGHYLNWYHTENLATMQPLFVSTVDSGNLAASLWALKESALRWANALDSEAEKQAKKQTGLLLAGLHDHARLLQSSAPGQAAFLADAILKVNLDTAEPPFTRLTNEAAQARGEILREIGPDSEAAWWAHSVVERIRAAGESAHAETIQHLHWIANNAARLVAEMDFSFLYLRTKKVLSVGYDIEASQLNPSGYDLLASEARVAAFIAIAKGDVPQESWFHLGRAHALAEGRRALLSWSGTLFEYLLPALWMRHYADTLLGRTCMEIVQIQQRYGARKRLPWGVSESAYPQGGGDAEYPYRAFGLRAVAMNPRAVDCCVITPYASALALTVSPSAAYRNLERLRSLGLVGTRGFFESADFANPEHPEIVRAWMAHHQGMILISICNCLHHNIVQEDFHHEPFVEATERILHELPHVPRALPESDIATPDADVDPALEPRSV